MAENKDSFVLYARYYHTIKKLPKDKAGELFMTILEYVNDLNPEPTDILVEVTFEPIKQQLKRDLKKWEVTKIDKSTGGRVGNLKRWNPDLYEAILAGSCSLLEAESIASHRKASHTDKTDRIPSDSIASVAVNVNEDVNVNVNDNVNDNVINTSTVVDEAVDTEKMQKQSYSFLDKNFLTVCQFINESNPKFSEPYFDLWNFFAKETGKPILRVLSPDRKKKLNTRIREPEFNMVEILAKARDSNLIRNGGWFSFDWITTSQSNYIKVLEGNYDNHEIEKKNGTKPNHTSYSGNSKQQQNDAVNDLISQVTDDINQTYPRTG